MNRAWAGLVVVTFVAACGGGNGSSDSMTTPTTVVGIWDLASADFTNGQQAAASGVLSMQLRSDGTASIVSCLSPTYSGTTLVCTQMRVCGTGTYTYVGSTLTITETGRTDTRGGPIIFSAGTMTVSGSSLLGASVSAAHFHAIGQLPNNCP